MAEESKIIDEVLSSTEETPKSEGFDPTSFMTGSEDNVNNLSEQPQSETPQAEETQTADNEDDGFSWESVEVEEPVAETEDVVDEVVEETEEDWDSDETENVESQEPTAPELNWEEIGKETGIEAASKEEFIEKVKDALKPAVQENDVIKNLNSYLELSDKELVIADMRAAKYDNETIEDTIDRLDTAGLLKREATMVRSQLTKHIHSEKDRIRQEEKQAEQQKTEGATKSRKELQNFIKGKEEFFGGKVSQKDKKQLYNYITKGNFAQEVFESHANVAEAAFLWRNKEKIFKMVRTQGVEQGKSRILDGITSPSKGSRSSKSFEAPKKGFDPKKFLT